MRSTIPKVLHPLCGAPMLEHVMTAIEEAGISRSVVIIGHGQDQVQAHLGSRAEYAIQAERLGTAHAVMMAEPNLEGFEGDVLICCGDTPLLRPSTLHQLVERRRASGAVAIVLTAHLKEPKGYGRILRDSLGRVLRIVEQKDCSPEEARIREVNTGVYCARADLLFSALQRVENNNAQKEYYLPDIIPILARDGHKVEGVVMDDESEMIGINSRQQLAHAANIMRTRLLDALMDQGVTIVDPETTFLHRSVRVGRDTVIHPMTTLKGDTHIGESCEIGPGALLSDAVVGDGCTVGASELRNCRVGNGVKIASYTIVRDGTEVGNAARLGSFLDLAATHVEPGTRLPSATTRG